MRISIHTTLGTYQFEVTSVTFEAALSNFTKSAPDQPRPIEVPARLLEAARPAESADQPANEQPPLADLAPEPSPEPGGGAPEPEPPAVADPRTASACIECGQPATLFIMDPSGSPTGGACSWRCLATAAARRGGTPPPVVVNAQGETGAMA